jgi:small multidrug resistance family-3 protein
MKIELRSQVFIIRSNLERLFHRQIQGQPVRVRFGELICTSRHRNRLPQSNAEDDKMEKISLPVVAWLIFLGAAALEVGGDAVIRKGMRGGGWALIAGGCLLLAGYGLVVNLVKWDFSKLLGIYVAVFALVSVHAGRFLFGEKVPVTTWAGMGIIVLGGLVIQFGEN